jgi:hypothetical protein
MRREGIFGFAEKELFVFDSALYGNATYVVGNNWAALSQRTKAELIHGDDLVARLVHDDTWRARIAQLLG